jgi:hypothetical protein
VNIRGDPSRNGKRAKRRKLTPKIEKDFVTKQNK